MLSSAESRRGQRRCMEIRVHQRAGEPDQPGLGGPGPFEQWAAISRVAYAKAGCPCWRLRRRNRQKNRPPVAAAAMITTMIHQGNPAGVLTPCK